MSQFEISASDRGRVNSVWAVPLAISVTLLVVVNICYKRRREKVTAEQRRQHGETMKREMPIW